jgi:hypothetical protein
MLIVLANARPWIMVGGIVLAIAVVIFFVDRLFAWLAKNGAKAMRNDKAAGGMSGLLTTFEGLSAPNSSSFRKSASNARLKRAKLTPPTASRQSTLATT